MIWSMEAKNLSASQGETARGHQFIGYGLRPTRLVRMISIDFPESQMAHFTIVLIIHNSLG